MSQAKDITDEVAAAIKYALIMQHATSGNFKEGGIMQNAESQEAILNQGERVINTSFSVSALTNFKTGVSKINWIEKP